MISKNIKEIIYDYYTDLIVDDVISVDSYRFYTSPKIDTACWYYHNNQHHIVIGEKVKTNANHYEYAVRDLLYHEVAHGLWTPRPRSEEDIQLMNDLKTYHIPFYFYNLFEDARIESLVRKKLHIDFEWSVLHTLENEDAIETATSMFYALIYYNGDEKKLKNIPLSSLTDKRHEMRKQVIDFYQKTVEAKSANDLIPILREWLHFIGYDENKRWLYKTPIIYSEFSFHETMQSCTFEEFVLSMELEEVTTPQQSIGDTTREFDKSDFTRLFNLSNNAAHNRVAKVNLLAPEPIEYPGFDHDYENLLELFEDLFTKSQHSYYQASRQPTKSIKLKNYLLDHPKFYKQQKMEYLPSNIKFTMVIDMSGSMSMIIEKSYALFRVMNLMAKYGYMEITFILSAIENSTAVNQVLHLPIEDQDIARIDPRFLGEGLTDAMRENITIIEQSDIVWVYSDGMTLDEPVKRSLLKRFSGKIYGVYLGEQASIEEWNEYFDNIIVEPTIEQLSERFKEILD
jgi:hypothetical protein